MRVLATAIAFFIASDALEAAAEGEFGSAGFILTDVILPLITLVGLVAVHSWLDRRYRRTTHANDWVLTE